MDPSRLREISILVDSLDMQRADKLLEKLPEELQQKVRQAVVQLDDVSDQERKDVIDRFLGRSGKEPTAKTQDPSPPASASGVYENPRLSSSASNQKNTNTRPSLPPELANKLGIKTQPAVRDTTSPTSSFQEEAPIRSCHQPSENPKPVSDANPIAAMQSVSAATRENSNWDLVEEILKADLDTLAEVVLRESPQFNAVVLSLLPADKSVQILELFPNQVQGEILRRLESLDHVGEEILDEISRQLKEVLTRRKKVKKRQSTGRVAIAKILSAAQRVKSGAVAQRIENQLNPATDARTSFLPPSQQSQNQLVATGAATKSSAQSVERNQVEAYQFAHPGHPVGAVSAGVPQLAGEVRDEIAGKSKLNGKMGITSGYEDSGFHQESPESRITGKLSAAEQILKRQLEGPENGEPKRSEPKVAETRTKQQLEQSLLTDEVDSVQGFADQEIKIPFEKLQKCDKASLQSLLATAKPKLTLLALRGAPAGLTKKVLKMLPSAEAKEVQFRIQNMGPTRLQDIEKAQNYLLRLASMLEKLGRFRFPRGIFG